MTQNIHFSGIDKHFGKRQVLCNADLMLSGGSCLLLSGANGSGKTTLLRICAGLEKPDHGYVNMGKGGQPWKQYRQTLQTNVVYLHQQPYMFEGNVEKNLAYALPRSMTKAERQRRIDIALEWAGLENIAYNSAKTLSGGERQRVAIARAWLRQPTVMLLDEPTSNMDSDARQSTLNLLVSLKRQGIALLIASHDAEHFYSKTDQWLHLSNGQIERNELLFSENNITHLHNNQKQVVL